MSELMLEEKNGKLKGVFFAYTKIQRAVENYNKDGKEYVTDAVIDKATAKEMKKLFPKNGVREVDNEDFEEHYKFEPPFPEQEEQYLVKFKNPAAYKDGTEKPYEYTSRPKVYVPVEGGVKDVTLDVRVGNGSQGDIAFSTFEVDGKKCHRLTAILVTEMVELEGSFEPFGTVVNDHENEEVDVPF